MKKISKLIDRKVWLAPLAGFTDNSYRKICKMCGAEVILSEMVSADGLVYGDEKTHQYMDFSQEQRPYGIQLFGSDADVMRKATRIAMKLNPELIDVNMGCPVKKVVNRKAGSALMKHVDLAQSIVEAMAKELKNSEIALSVKFRAGWDLQSVNSTDFGIRLQNCGADIICLHPRTRSQMFEGHSNWDLIKDLKDNVSVPVVGNGDIRSYDDAERMYNETGCDSIMIGRGAIGNPWIFDYVNSKNELIYSNDKKFEIVKQHFLLAIDEKGENRAIREMRSHISYYTKGIRGGAKVRNFVNKSLDVNEILQAVRDLYGQNK